MLICTRCNAGDSAKLGFPDAVILLGTVGVPGEKQAELEKELTGEYPKPRLTGLELHAPRPPAELKIDLNSELVCGACKRSGTIEDGAFKLVNRCRCGACTDDIFICYAYRTILCRRCADSYECRSCTNEKCEYKVKKPSKKKDSTRKSRSPRVRPSRSVESEAETPPIIFDERDDMEFIDFQEEEE